MFGPHEALAGDRPTVVLPPRDFTSEELAAERAAQEHQDELERRAARQERRAELADQARIWVATAFEVGGILVMAWGLHLLAVWLGIAVAGLGLTLVGVAMDPPEFLFRRAAPTESAE